MRRAQGLLLAALAGVALFFSRSATAAQTSILDQDTSDAPSIPADTNADVTPLSDVGGWLVSSDPNKNVGAFLYMIRASEHFLGDADTGAAYQIYYGGTRFNDLSDHPAITGEKKGVPLAASVCINAGLAPGCVSTAAGAYQIIKSTWQDVRAGLPDFSPASQDNAAIRLLSRSGALALVQTGDIDVALDKANNIWASLPGSPYGQTTRKYAYAQDRFNDFIRNAS